MPAQEKLSRTEQILAYLIGGGIALAVVALFLYGLGVANTDFALSTLLVGLALIVIGISAWLYLLKPWNHFDDLKTPFYTGHHGAEHEHAEPAAEPEAQAAAPPAAVPPAPGAPAVPPPPPAETPAPPAAPATPAEVFAEEHPPEAKPAPQPEPKAAIPEAEGEPDKLTMIEGIGPKSAEALNKSGVTTFEQVAAMTPDALEEAVKSQKVRLVGSTETWPMQARLLADGDLDGLEALKARISGGVLLDED